MSSTPALLRPMEDEVTEMKTAMKVVLKVVLAVVVFPLVVAITMIVVGSPGRKTPTGLPANAVQVGDTVSLYPTTIICGDKNDASRVYKAGVIAVYQTLRLDNDVQKALEAEREASKLAMRDAYSCQWAPYGAKYIVQEKNVFGTEQDVNAFLFHYMQYCLRPVTGDRCLWVEFRYSQTAFYKVVPDNGSSMRAQPQKAQNYPPPRPQSPARATPTGTLLDALSPAEQERLQRTIDEKLRNVDVEKALRESRERTEASKRNLEIAQENLCNVYVRQNLTTQANACWSKLADIRASHRHTGVAR